MIAEIRINVHLTEGTSFTATALSFERAQEELATIERKIEKLTKEDVSAPIPF